MIKTQYVHPPIPSRNFDWMAWDDDTYDGAPDSPRRNQLGHGPTEGEAVVNLIALLAEDCAFCGRTALKCECPHSM